MRYPPKPIVSDREIDELLVSGYNYIVWCFKSFGGMFKGDIHSRHMTYTSAVDAASEDWDKLRVKSVIQLKHEREDNAKTTDIPPNPTEGHQEN